MTKAACSPLGMCANSYQKQSKLTYHSSSCTKGTAGCQRKHGDNWEAAFRAKLEQDLPSKDLMFLLGTIHRFPHQWLLISLIYPSKPNTVRLTVRPEPVEGSGRTRTELRQAQHERIWHLTEQYCDLTLAPRVIAATPPN